MTFYEIESTVFVSSPLAAFSMRKIVIVFKVNGANIEQRG